MTVLEGLLLPPVGRFVLAAARFNQLVVHGLIDGARDALRRHGTPEDAIDLVMVPGSFELPLVARRLAGSGRYEAVIALGAVIRGATDHYDHVAAGVTSGLMQAALATGVPVIFGVLTCDTLEQALDRAGAKAGNKGADAALAALEMAHLLRQLPTGPASSLQATNASSA